MMQTVTREQALAGTLALVNPAHPLQARPAPEALVPAMPDAPGVLLARQAAVMLAALLDGIRAAGRIVPVSGWRRRLMPSITSRAMIRHREAANAAQRYLDFLCIGGHAPLFPSVFRL